MTTKLSALGLGVVLALVGCAAPTSDAGEDPATADGQEEELKSAECPASVEVTLSKPRIMSNTKLTDTWSKSFESDFTDKAEAQAEAQQQLTDLTSHLKAARGEGAVTLKGTLGKACFYATVDAKSGKANGFRLWFAKTAGKNGGLQLRIARDLGGPDTLFFQAPVKSLTPTTVKVDTSKDATVNAQHNIPEFHGEPGGPNAWIGFADVTAKIAH